MTAPPAISVRNVAKAYRIWNTPAARIQGLGWQIMGSLLPTGSRLGRWIERREARLYRDFHALNEVNLEVAKGEAVGIVGRNGSGKSTLLQIIAGTLQPSRGTVEVQGRVAALLELGSGFDPEFTGRENVYLNASILGLSRPQIDARFAAIVAFADIGDFIEQPVKTYSSGMLVRLAFAVQVQIEPDILIVDEALAVGDAFFQHRCLRRMEELRTRGMSLLFVSHDSAMVRHMCQRCLLLERGQPRMLDETNRVLSEYTHLLDRQIQSAHGHSPAPVPVSPAGVGGAETLLPVTTIANIDRRLGEGQARIEGLGVFSADGSPCTSCETGAELEIRLTLQAGKALSHPLVGVNIYDKLRNEITATNTEYEKCALPALRPGDRLTVSFLLSPPPLAPGIYSVDAAVNDGSQEIHTLCDWIVNAAVFEISSADRFHGRIRIPVTIRHAHAPASAFSPPSADV